METFDLTLENFTNVTGIRFRITREQAARIALTEMTDEVRNSLVGLTVEQAADALDARSKKGKPMGWIKDALEMLEGGWHESMSLTREGAFEEFVGSARLQAVLNRRPKVPDSVYLDPELTLENFPEKVQEAIGFKGRFRPTRDQKQRINAGELTREQALAEVVEDRRAKLVTEESNNNE